MSHYDGPAMFTKRSEISASETVSAMRSTLAACFRKNLVSFTIAQLVSGGRACCSLDLIEVGLQICAGPLNQRKGANWCATFSGELDQVVQVGAEFAGGFDRTGNTHLAFPP
jgi:hypothetical protein